MASTTVNLGFEVRISLSGDNSFLLAMGLNVGGGPTQFVIEPSLHQDPRYFTLGGLVTSMGEFLEVDALKNLADLKSKVPPPWNNIFDIGILPKFVVSIAKSSDPKGEPSGFQCVFSLYDNGVYGIQIGGKTYGPIKIEPSFTVYDLIISYRSGEGLSLSARVTFEELEGAKTAMLALGQEPKSPAKTEVVKFPFASPSPATPTFRVNYLGLGQRFGPDADLTSPDPITKIFDDLEANLVSNDPAQVINTLVKEYYKPNRNWFIAADLEVRGWRIRAIFNDPSLYGLQITCAVDQFKGLLIEILYQKLGPGLGVFYGALTLPIAYRQIQLGVVAITVPSFRIWIYTNGDFKIAVGWPLGPNSFGIQVYIFTGGAGFWFAKLRSGDNPNNPGTVNYNPILGLGLALWFGVGRSIDKGVLKAELSLTLQATFQGILAWKANTNGDSQGISRAPDYFWFAATVGIVGVLQGSVDLKIISASVLVRLSATASIAFETNYGTEVTVTASVSVSVTIKILFIKISASFSATITVTFTLSSSPNGFANVIGPRNPAFAGIVPPLAARSLPAAEPVLLVVPPLAPIAVDVSFVLMPAGLYGPSVASLQAVATLMVPTNAPDGTGPKDFLNLCTGIATWLLNTYAPNTGDWNTIAGILGDNGEGAPADFETKLTDYLVQYATFTVSGVDLTQANADTADLPVSMFPMFAELQMQPSNMKDPILFSACVTPADYAQRVADYFAQLSISGLMSNPPDSSEETRLAATDALTGPPATTLLFFDYFLLIARDLANSLSDSAAEADAPMPTPDIAAKVGGLATRYLMNGPRLPNPAQSPPPTNPYEDEIISSFVVTGQQFAVDDKLTSVNAVLSLTNATGLGKTIKFAGAGNPTSVTSTMAVQPLPAEPKPKWTVTTVQPALNAAVAEIDININQLLGADSRLAWYASRRPIPWKRPNVADAYLLPMPPPIVTLARTATKPITLGVQKNNPDSSADEVEVLLPNVPALFIPIRVTRVAVSQSVSVTSDGTPIVAYVPNTYQITGTDESTRELIDLALQGQDLSTATISLLYDAKSDGYASDVIDTPPANHHALLFKSNLSTTSQPAGDAVPLLKVHAENVGAIDLGPTYASKDEVQNFLTLLWEVSVVNTSGFYLYYADKDGKGLDDSLFGAVNGGDKSLVSDGYANLVVAVEFPKATTIRPYHNFLALSGSGALTDSIYVTAYVDSVQIVEFDPAYPAGCIGVDIEWDLQTTALASSPEGLGSIYDAAWIERLYHLIEFQIQKTPAGPGPEFQSSLWSNALSPTKASESGDQQTYRQVIPVYQFAGATIDLNKNLYAAIGGKPEIAFCLVDTFGNVLADQTFKPQFPVLYNDRLVSLAEWPGVTVYYRFDPNEGSPTFFLDVEFDSKGVVQSNPEFLSAYHLLDRSMGRSTEDEEKVDQQIRIALFKYRTIVDQLADPNTILAVSTSVLPSNGGVIGDGAGIKAKLLVFAQQIVKVLNDFLTIIPVDPVEIPLTIPIAIDITDVQKQVSNIFAVEAAITLSRPKELVDPTAYVQVPESGLKRLILKPNLLVQPTELALRANGAATDGTDLLPFATQFEKTFLGFGGAGSQLKMAERTGLDPTTSDAESASLWAMRWSTDFGITAALNQNEVAFFTLQPLNTHLMGGTADVPTYDSNLTPTYAPKQFSSVDLDGWAEVFLRAFDRVLSPATAAAIAAQNGEVYTDLMERKAWVAQAVSRGLAPVFVLPNDKQTGRKVVDGDEGSARDRVEQALLGSLASAYSSSTVVQIPANITAVGSVDPNYAPRLFGGISPNDQETGTKQFAITNGKIQLVPTAQAPQFLTFLVTAKDPTHQASVVFDPVWKASFSEFLLESGEEEYDYLPSSWLKFVVVTDTPLDFPVGALNVPIALRTYPNSPLLQAQTAVGVQNDKLLAASKIPNPIPDVLKWIYSVDLQQELAAQDEFWLETTYNQPLGNTPPPAPQGNRHHLTADYFGDPTGLFQALAGFVTAWTQLEPFVDHLHDLVFDGGTETPTADQIITALQVQIDKVASHWGAMRRIVDREGKLLFPVTYRFESKQAMLQLNTDVTSYRYVVRIKDDNTWTVFGNTIDVPFPTINGQSQQYPPVKTDHGPDDESTWYETTIARSGALGEFAWQPLSLLTQQTAIAQAWVVRNSDLSEDSTLQTNPKLVYQTPFTKFPNPILPSIIARKIAPWDPGETLSYYLKETLVNLVPTALSMGNSCQVRIEARYTFSLATWPDSPSAIQTEIAMLLVENQKIVPDPPPASADDDDSSTLDQFVAALTLAMNNWYGIINPSTVGATIELDVTLFAGLGNAQLPILQLFGITIPVPSGWWPPTETRKKKSKS